MVVASPAGRGGSPDLGGIPGPGSLLLAPLKENEEEDGCEDKGE